MTTAKVTTVIETLTEFWADAAESAIARASEPLDGVTGVRVDSWMATVVNGVIGEYKATVKCAFPVHDSAI